MRLDEDIFCFGLLSQTGLEGPLDCERTESMHMQLLS